MSNEVMPAFYGCYLLRSATRRSFYIGSTPNPARRLAQHNGKGSAGAKHTSKQTNRPWEMVCLVHSFPSRVAALQFEWAWQNAHATRHLEREVPASPRKSKARPPRSLEARLKNLMKLLQVPYWARYWLHIQFFAEDVYNIWKKHAAKVDGGLRRGVEVSLTPAELPTLSTDGKTYTVPSTIREIPVAYEDCKAHVEKARSLLADSSTNTCRVCKQTAGPLEQTLICPTDDCSTVSHLACLSKRFREEEGPTATILPLEGTCPGCHTPTAWYTLAKELSLRLYGQKEVEALLKPKRRRKAKDDPTSGQQSAEPETLGEEDEDLDETWLQDVTSDEEEFPPIEKVAKTKRPRSSPVKPKPAKRRSTEAKNSNKSNDNAQTLVVDGISDEEEFPSIDSPNKPKPTVSATSASKTVKAGPARRVGRPKGSKNKTANKPPPKDTIPSDEFTSIDAYDVPRRLDTVTRSFNLEPPPSAQPAGATDDDEDFPPIDTFGNGRPKG